MDLPARGEMFWVGEEGGSMRIVQSTVLMLLPIDEHRGEVRLDRPHRFGVIATDGSRWNLSRIEPTHELRIRWVGLEANDAWRDEPPKTA